MTPHHYLTLAEASDLVRRQELSPVEVAGECLKRIEEFNSRLNAFITVTAPQALEQAGRAEAEIGSGQWKGPLHGIPVGIKDFFDTVGVKTTGAFEPLRNRVPGKDADIVRRLKEGGAVIIGKTNMHVLGMGTTSVESCFGPVHNPWNLEYAAGGSSGGSAAAVAAGLCFATVDTDAIGSCRLPAACCGVVGFKPTFGLLSTQGILEGEPVDEETARTIARIGHAAITCRTAEDVALVLSVAAMAGSDRSAPGLDDPQPPLIGITTNYSAVPEVRSAFEQAVQVLRCLGYRTLDIEAPLHSAGFSLANIEQDRKTIAGSLFKDIDVLLLPTTTDLPPRIEEVRTSRDHQAIAPDNTFFCNYYGLPAVSVPCGFSRAGLPLGFQIAGPQGHEAAVLKLAHAYQQTPEGRPKHPVALSI